MPDDRTSTAAGATDTVTTTVGDLVAAFMEAAGVTAAFGVISIHNMPVLDAIARRGKVRFVPARGEAGALNMADAYARLHGGLGVGITSTGVAAGNAAGSLVEALTAGTPLLHITGQIETPYLDRGRAYIHEAPRQPDMLAAVSKAFFRIWSPDAALGVLREAARVAMTAPAGPVSIEIPIDVQAAPVPVPDRIDLLPPSVIDPPAAAVDRLAELLIGARRPMLWLGGGARGASAAVARLAAAGVGIVTSVNGRGVLPEDRSETLGAFNAAVPVEEFYATCDLMIVAGSRLRGNETLKYTLSLPKPLVQIDADPTMDSRAYPADLFVCGDAALALSALADGVEGRLSVDPSFAGDLAAARVRAVETLRAGLGPYAPVIDALRAEMPKDAPWVRDLTVSNSMWGNRYLDLHDPRQGVHPLGGAIGQGAPMAIGAALGRPDARTVLLTGDGGLALCIGELATMVQERAKVAVILMNDSGYAVIRNIQDVHYGGRNPYVDLHTPDFAALCGSIDLPHRRVADAGAFGEAFRWALAADGPAMVEVDMKAIGSYAQRFAGPPVRKKG